MESGEGAEEGSSEMMCWLMIAEHWRDFGGKKREREESWCGMRLRRNEPSRGGWNDEGSENETVCRNILGIPRNGNDFRSDKV